MALNIPRLLPTRSYPFQEWRHMLAATALQEGVVGDELKVSQRAAGANMSVDVAAANQGAWVRGDDTARQGVYHVFNDAILNVPVTAAHATLPRIDQIILRIYDSSIIGGGLDQGAVELLQGTPTGGATLANRTGAAALPATAIRLADVLVPAASASVVTANIVDRRPWARGAYYSMALGADATTNATVLAAHATLRTSIELSGVPVKVRIRAAMNTTVTPSTAYLSAQLNGANALSSYLYLHLGRINASVMFEHEYVAPAAGRASIGAMWAVDSGTLTMLAGATLTVEEIIRPNATNA